MSDDGALAVPKLQRRQFLANLLFSGGALTLASLQPATAAGFDQPIEEGWELPREIEERLQRKSGSRIDPVPSPRPEAPKPSPTPQESDSPSLPPPPPQRGLTPRPAPAGGRSLPGPRPDQGCRVEEE